MKMNLGYGRTTSLHHDKIRSGRSQTKKKRNAIYKAITAEGFDVSSDRHSLSLRVERGPYVVPLTVEGVDGLALKSRILAGKWLVYRPRNEIDSAWLVIARATFDKTLGIGAKVSTRGLFEPEDRGASQRLHATLVVSPTPAF